MMILTAVTGVIAAVAKQLLILGRMLITNHEVAERAKRDIVLQTLKHVKYGMMCSQEAVNLVVQSTKRNDCSAQEVANLGRIARGQLGLLLEEVTGQESKLSSWTFGKLFDAREPATNVGVPEQPRRHGQNPLEQSVIMPLREL